MAKKSQPPIDAANAYEQAFVLLQQNTYAAAATAIPLLEAAAAQKNADARLLLANCYALGYGVERDMEQAVQWYTKAAMQGHPTACKRLSQCYADGNGVEPDAEMAAYWLAQCEKHTAKPSEQTDEKTAASKPRASKAKSAATKKSPAKSTTTAKSKAKAAEETTPAKKTDDQIEALIQRALRFYEGDGVKQDLKKAAKLFAEAAETGAPSAVFALGCCYLHGEGVAKDEKKGFALLTQSAKAGYPPAQNDLGCCYEAGVGTKKNEAKAFECYKAAALAGDAGGMLNMGSCYERGIGTKVNRPQMAIWYKKAAENGNILAQLFLTLSALSASKTDKRKKAQAELPALIAAIPELEEFASMVVASKCREIGRFYSGRYGDKYANPEKTEFWYTQAMEKGDASARDELIDLYGQIFLSTSTDRDTKKVVKQKMKDLGVKFKFWGGFSK